MTRDAPATPSATAGIQPLGEAACLELLARHRLCTLSLVDNADPYAVPLFYGFDGTTLYLGLAEGRKTRILDVNPRVCLTVVETGPADSWACVQVMGTAQMLDAGDREEGVRVLMEHNRRVREAAGAASPASGAGGPTRRHSGGRVVRIRNPEISGRTRT